VDLEAFEAAIRTAALQAGAQVLEDLLRQVGVVRRKQPQRCRCGAVMDSRGVKAKSVVTLLGGIRFARSCYQCPVCGATRYPGDEELDAVKTGYSPGVRRLVSELACDVPFKRTSHYLKAAATLTISRKDCERIAEGVGEDVARWFAAERDRIRFTEPPPPQAPKPIKTLYIEFDGTGLPVVPRERENRKGKQEDGSSKTREAKLGCVFTQTGCTEKGRPIRDPASSSFVGAIEPAEQFQWRIYAEAVRRGLFEAQRVVIVTDGAEWIRNIVQTHFPAAIHIIDLYHARQHLVEMCKLLFDRDLKRLNQYKDQWWDNLDEGNIETIVEEARSFLPKDLQAAKDARTEINYFDKNKTRMRYADYFAQGLFVGSGVIEAGCKNLIGQRLKQSGMEWTIRGANAITALRCAVQSNRFESYWETRAI
jgi:hypothetical protein